MNDGDNKTIESLFDGQILIIKNVGDLNSLFCPVCHFPLKTLEDNVSFRKIGACNLCEMKWYGTRLGNWESGWRPNNTTEGWDEYIENRKLMARQLINIK